MEVYKHVQKVSSNSLKNNKRPRYFKHQQNWIGIFIKFSQKYRVSVRKETGRIWSPKARGRVGNEGLRSLAPFSWYKCCCRNDGCYRSLPWSPFERYSCWYGASYTRSQKFDGTESFVSHVLARVGIFRTEFWRVAWLLFDADLTTGKTFRHSPFYSVGLRWKAGTVSQRVPPWHVFFHDFRPSKCEVRIQSKLWLKRRGDSSSVYARLLWVSATRNYLPEMLWLGLLLVSYSFAETRHVSLWCKTIWVKW